MLSKVTLANEIVKIIGILGNRDGSTMRDVSNVLESLHGPLDRELVQDSLMEAVTSGRISCFNRRYTINMLSTLYDSPMPGCSNWSDHRLLRLRELRDNEHSVSSLSTEVNQTLYEDSSCPSECCSVEELLSARSILSSDQLSSCSQYCDSCTGSEESVSDSEQKEIKKQPKKRLVVRWPTKKNVAGNTKDNLDGQQELESTVKDRHRNLPAKRSVNDMISEVMKRFLKNTDDCHNEQENNASQNNNCDLIVDESLNEDMTKVMMRFGGNTDTRDVASDEMSSSPDGTLNITSANRSVQTGSENPENPRSSKSVTPKPAKRKRKAKQDENTSGGVSNTETSPSQSGGGTKEARSEMQSNSDSEVPILKKSKPS